jgi:glycosyltransferase involved in cell wall biosynthesis
MSAGALLFKTAALLSVASSVQTIRAQQRVLSTVATRPPYQIEEGPLVSVIIPAYNEENYLPAVIAALYNQTYLHFEIIVVDNQSEDLTVKVATDMGARVVVNEEYNVSRSRNMGAQAASGEILLFIDADTIPEAAFIEKAVQEIGQGAVLVSPTKILTDFPFIYSVFKLVNETAFPRRSSACLAVSRDAFEAVGGFNEDCLPQENCSEELDLILRLEQVGPASYLRWTYAGTSSRRFKQQGLLPAPNLWEERAYRRRVT